MAYGSGERAGDNARSEHAETSGRTLYPMADEMSVPGLSRLREELERAVETGDWRRVAELASALARG